MNNVSLLVIGNDPSLLDVNSQAHKRVKDYAGVVDRYDVVTVAEKDAVIEISSSAFVFGIKKTNKLITYFNLVRFLLNKIKKVDYKIISAQDPFEFGLLAFWLAKNKNCKLHLQEHGDFFGTGSKFWLRESILNYPRYFLGKYLLKKADGVRVVSQRVKTSLIKIGVKQEKILVVPIIETNIFPTPVRAEDNEFSVIFVGRMVRAKNIPMLLKAIDICYKTNGFKGKFSFIGDGDLKGCVEKFIFKNKLIDHIKLINWTNDLKDIYASADVLVLTSWHEGWGRVVVDAGACGVVPIMTKVGCADELVENNKNGLLVNFNNHYELAEKILYLFKNKDDLKRMSNNIKNDVKSLSAGFDLSQQMLISWQKTINS